MNFEDERYVRVYTRDTTTWKLLPWNARSVLLALFRKVDRAGILPLDGEDAVEVVAAMVDAPLEVVAEALPHLVKRGIIEVSDRGVVVPRFLEAQECKQSDPARKRAQRERRRAEALGDDPSRSVTDGHATGQEVTLRDRASALSSGGGQKVTPCRAVPSRTDPTRAVPERSGEDVPSEIPDQPEPPGDPDAPSPSVEGGAGKPSREQQYAAAYAAGIARGKGSPYAFPGGFAAQGDLNTVLPTFALGPNGKALRGGALLAWIEAKAEAFADFASGEDPKFWSSYNPKGFKRWLNERGAGDDDQGDAENPYASTTEYEIRPDPTPEERAATQALFRATYKRLREADVAARQALLADLPDEAAP